MKRQSAPGRPNILLLLTDEHGAQYSGTYGHPFIRTPAMDRLAAEGVTFDAAYCNNPLCVPSRLSFLTGRYTHHCAGWDNEQSARVPLQVRWPGRAAAGRRVGECVSLVDVTATIVEAAGAASPAAPMDGHHLTKLLRGPDPDWEDAAFAELTAHGTDRPRAMLRQGNWKLCLSGGDDPEPELYDLEQDPRELSNRAGDPVVAMVEERLRGALLARWDWRRIDHEVRGSQQRRQLIRAATGGRRSPF